MGLTGFVSLFVGCFTAHQPLGHIGPTLSGDKEYIRREMANSRLLRLAGLGRGSIQPIRCHTGKDIGCRIHTVWMGCGMYADDILLSSASVGGIQILLNKYTDVSGILSSSLTAVKVSTW
jgi:hypothetical protein